jgi:hypothetical protein
LHESRGEKALREAVEQFAADYRKFLHKHKQYSAIPIDVDRALAKASQTHDIHESAQVFRHELSSILEIRNRKDQDKSGNWASKVGSFLKHIYPICKVSLQVVGKLGEASFLFLTL